jgi:hypothetical protein
MRSSGLRYWTTKTRSVAAVDICYGVGGGGVTSMGSGLGRHLHSLALLGLTPGVGASRFGAAPAGLLSPLVCSPYMYIAVYYLCCLQMPRSSSCPSPATNRYARLFPSPPALRNLGSRGGEGWGL